MKPDHRMSEKYLNSSYRKHFDLSYDEKSESQKLDLWLPDEPSKGPYPVIMYFHGGGFRMGAKRENQSEPVIRALEQGYAVADVEYRKSGEAIFPAMLLDAKAAVRFLRASAAEYDLDSNKIAAWGASCGGWIVGMLGATAGEKSFMTEDAMNREQSDAVQAVVDWCGPCGDFLLMDSDFAESGVGPQEHTAADTSEGLFMGSCLTDIPELCAYAAPVNHIKNDMPPTLILHGTLDKVVPIQQSRRFSVRIASVAGKERVEYHELDGMGHHSRPWNDNPDIARITMDFLNRVFQD